MTSELTPMVDLPLEQQAPLPALFLHQSDLHGQGHVARVMVHASLLARCCGLDQGKERLWAAVFIHDIARTHDGVCHEHGKRAVARLRESEDLESFLHSAGVRPSDYDAIATAVENHCRPEEFERSHPHWRLTALLKDADGLDRVRLGDLNEDYLRFEPSRRLVPFAEALFARTAHLTPGEGLFPLVWRRAQAILRETDQHLTSEGE